MPDLPPTYRDWLPRLTAETPDAIRALYERGFKGAYKDQAADEELAASLPEPVFGDVCDRLGLWNTDAPDLMLPFLHVVRAEADAAGIKGTLEELSQNPRVDPWPERQTTGDCVSHWARNGYDLTRAAEIYHDGEPEGWHVRTATEPIYGARGHSGEGANCSRLLQFLLGAGGLLRKRHEVPGFGVLDLSSYKAQIGMNWGRTGVPAAVSAYAKANSLSTGAKITSWEQVEAAFASGRCAGGCSGLGFTSTRNADGVSEQSGGWAHAMQWSGLDRRKETIAKYGGPLVLVQNSWGRWNKGPRLIRGTNIAIPEGSFWMRQRSAASMIKGGGIFTMAGVKGWAPLRLPDLGATGII
jgi:hypothetical protein